MADLDDLPDLTDGATPITTGTPVDEAWWDLVQAALLGELRGASDPTRTPAQTTDEMLAARGAFASLLARLTDWEARQYLRPRDIRHGLLLGNLLANDTFLMWSQGDAAAPDHWTVGGGAVARCGVGQADTQVITSQGHFSAKLTNSGAAAILQQNALDGSFTAASALLNNYLPVDAAGNIITGYESGDEDAVDAYVVGHAWCNAASRARFAIEYQLSRMEGDYHPGDGAWHSLLAGPLRYVGGSTTRFRAECRVETAGDAYFQCVSMLLVPAGAKPLYLPAKVRYVQRTYYANNPATGVLDYFTFSRPAFILGAQAQCLTAGTVTAPTIDLLTPIGGVYSSLFVTLPTIATGQLVGAAQACDPAAANYRRRTIRPALAASATQADNTSLRLDYVDDGGGTLRDLMVTIHAIEYDRPGDQFRAMTNLGE